MKKIIFLTTLLTMFGAVAETIGVDLNVKVNIPTCRRIGMVGTWDSETEYRVEILEVKSNGTRKLLGKQQKEGHVNFDITLKNKIIDSNSNIRVDVYEEDWGIYGADDYYPVGEASIHAYEFPYKDTFIYTHSASVNNDNCLELLMNETKNSIQTRYYKMK